MTCHVTFTEIMYELVIIIDDECEWGGSGVGDGVDGVGGGGGGGGGSDGCR